MNEQAPQGRTGGSARSGRGRIYGGFGVAMVVLIAAFQLRPRPAASQQPARASSPSMERQSAPAPTPPVAGAVPGAQAANSTGVIADGREPVTLIGTVQTDQATLSVVQPGRIVGIAVREGDRVQRGQTLVRLDPAQGQAQERTAAAGVEGAKAQLAKAQVELEAQQDKADSDVATARAGLQQAQEKLKQAQLGQDSARSEQKADLAAAQEKVHQAQLGLDEARKTLNSLEQLDSVGGVARNDLEGARTRVASAQSDLDQAEAQVQRLQAGPPGGSPFRIEVAGRDVAAAETGVRQAREGIATALRARQETLRLAQRDIQAAEAGVRQAEAGLSGAQSAAQFATLTSPLAGIVASTGAHQGEIAQPGTAIVTVVSQSGFRIEALVTARQLPRLYVGQTAQVTLDSRPGQTFAASLFTISRVAESDGRSFRIKLHLAHPPAELRPNQSARIRFAAKR